MTWSACGPGYFVVLLTFEPGFWQDWKDSRTSGRIRDCFGKVAAPAVEALTRFLGSNAWAWSIFSYVLSIAGCQVGR